MNGYEDEWSSDLPLGRAEMLVKIGHLDKIAESLDKTLICSKRWRRRLAALILPELREVAKALQDYYWDTKGEEEK